MPSGGFTSRLSSGRRRTSSPASDEHISTLLSIIWGSGPRALPDKGSKEEDVLYKIVQDLGLALTEFVPRLLGAVVVMITALVLAMVLQRSVARILEAIGLDEFAARTRAADSLQQLGYRGGPSRLLGLVLFWGIIITGVAGALS